MATSRRSDDDTSEQVLNDLASLQNRDADAAVCAALRTTLRLPSSIPEKFEDWLLAGIAAALALFINDIDKLASLIAPKTFLWSIDLLTVGLIAGGLGKVVGLIAAAQFTAYENAKPEIDRALDTEAEERTSIFQRAHDLKIDLDANNKFYAIFRRKYLATFIPITSWWIGWRMAVTLKKPHVHIAIYTSVVRKFQVRAICIVLAIAFSVIGAAVAVVSIHAGNFRAPAPAAVSVNQALTSTITSKERRHGQFSTGTERQNCH